MPPTPCCSARSSNSPTTDFRSHSIRFWTSRSGRTTKIGIAFVYGWQANAAIGNGVTLSLAGFGKIDDIGHAPSASQQEHIIGPLVGYEFEVSDKRTMAMELGVFFGLTEVTADTAFKGKLSYSF